MSKQTNDTSLSISVKTLVTISSILFLMIGEYIVLHKEIEVAKSLPKCEVSKIEIEYIKKDIELISKEIEEIKEEL